MLLVMHKQPIIQVARVSICDGVLGEQDALVSQNLMEQAVLYAVLKQELAQAVPVSKLDV